MIGEVGTYCEDNVRVRVEKIGEDFDHDTKRWHFRFRALATSDPHFITQNPIREGEEFEACAAQGHVNSIYSWQFYPEAVRS
jgi:hypothetical protein